MKGDNRKPMEGTESNLKADALLQEAHWVRLLARRLARNSHDADDVAQGALTLALQRKHGKGEGLRPWLAGVVSRLSRHQVRATTRRSDREQVAAAEGRRQEPPADDLLLRFESQQVLAAAVRELPEPYREVVLRRYYNGQSIGSIARAMGRPASTVRSQLTRAVARLRERFAGEELLDLQDGRRLGGLAILAVAAGGEKGGIPAMAASVSDTASSALGKGILTCLVASSVAVGLLVLVRDPFSQQQQDLAIPAALVQSETSPLRGGAGSTQREVAPTPPSIHGTRSASLEQAGANVDLDRVTRVRVRIFDEAGQPLPGASLRRYRRLGEAPGLEASAVADEFGVAQLSLTDGQIPDTPLDRKPPPLEVTAPGYRTQLIDSELVHDTLNELDGIHLAPGGSLGGRLIGPDGFPPRGGVVLVASASEDAAESPRGVTDMRQTVFCDEEGRFEVIGLTPGEVRVWARAQGTVWSLSAPVEVVAKELRFLGDVRLDSAPPARLVQGTVLNAGGGFAAQAVVSLHGSANWGTRSLITDERGEFQATVKRGERVELIAREGNGGTGVSPSTLVQAGEHIELQLVEAREIRLRVENSAGQPIVGGWILPLPLIDQGEEESRLEREPPPGAVLQRTDAQGTLLLSVTGDAVQFVVKATGYEPCFSQTIEYHTAPPEILLRPKLERVVSGVVLSAGGPLKGVQVRVEAQGKTAGSRWREYRPRSMVTDEYGRFVLPVGGHWSTARVRVGAPGLAPEVFAVELQQGQDKDGLILELQGQR